MARVILQSVKFKKDYMMMLAFLLFFLIVISECILIIWLPWHLRIDGMWAEQVAQQEVIELFDAVRSRSRHISGKLAKPAGAEAALICRSLDRMAGYMHKYGKQMSPQQCREMKDVLNKLNIQLKYCSEKKAFSQAIELDVENYLNTLRGIDLQRKAKN